MNLIKTKCETYFHVYHNQRIIETALCIFVQELDDITQNLHTSGHHRRPYSAKIFVQRETNRKIRAYLCMLSNILKHVQNFKKNSIFVEKLFVAMYFLYRS